MLKEANLKGGGTPAPPIDQPPLIKTIKGLAQAQHRE